MPLKITAIVLIWSLATPIFDSLNVRSIETKKDCDKELYLAPDSRLKVAAVGKLPVSGTELVGFEIVSHRPLVVTPHQLLGFDKNGNAALTIFEAIRAVSVDKDSRIFIQTAKNLQEFSQLGLKSDPDLASKIKGRLYNSGNDAFIEVLETDGDVQFTARNSKGGAFPIARIQGAFHAASWNQNGLAAVVDNSLYVWDPKNKNIVRMITDDGLSKARDVVLVSPERAIVALNSTVVLISKETIIVVATMSNARCRFDNGILFALDGKTGSLWTLAGIEALGTKAGDKDHATRLISEMSKGEGEDSARFMEAARILGCVAARKLLKAKNCHDCSE